MDSVVLNTPQEVHDFASAVVKLDNLTQQILELYPDLQEDCSWGVLCEYFVDESPAGPRMMKIDIFGNEPRTTIAG